MLNLGLIGSNLNLGLLVSNVELRVIRFEC